METTAPTAPPAPPRVDLNRANLHTTSLKDRIILVSVLHFTPGNVPKEVRFEHGSHAAIIYSLFFAWASCFLENKS